MTFAAASQLPLNTVAFVRLLIISLSVYPMPTAALADSWSPAQVEQVLSADGNSRVTVTPRDLTSPLAYFQDKLLEKDNPGLPKNAKNRAPRAEVEVQNSKGEWQPSWTVELINEVAPVEVLLSNDGQYLVTLDNWHRVGYGPSTIAIYKQKSGLVHAYDLVNFLPSYYVDALPKTTSSRSWRSGPLTIDNQVLAIGILVPDEKASFRSDDKKTVVFLFDMETGHVSKADTRAWIDAQSGALKKAKRQLEWEQKRLVGFIEPLIGNQNMTEREWHTYLREAYARTFAPASSGTLHLRKPSHAEYQKSVDWLNGYFSELTEVANEKEWYFDEMSIGSSDASNLTEKLTGIAKAAKPGAFRWGKYLIAVDSKYWPQIRSAFDHTKLQLALVDPQISIAQSDIRLDQIFNPPPRSADPLDDLF